MLEYLHLKNVGPAPEMELALAPRLNLLTGDNGLGKSFLLDIAWWALTRRWPIEANKKLVTGQAARPQTEAQASIDWRIKKGSRSEEGGSVFNRAKQKWDRVSKEPEDWGLLLYAMPDGSFALRDPARAKAGSASGGTLVFSPAEVWNGLRSTSSFGAPLCRGLIEDWALWQTQDGDAFQQLKAVLKVLSPDPNEKLEPGKLTRVSLNDVRDIPTLKTPYGRDVPITTASAGIRRVIALAYLLVWSWQEHMRASSFREQPPANQIVFLIDEVEAHLHPRWQRTIVRALLQVMGALSSAAEVQLIAATHSPLVMVSLEPYFDSDRDAWFDLDLVPANGAARVELNRRPFVRHGVASNWLTSEAFDLLTERSIAGEKAIEAARHLLRRSNPPTADEVRSVDQELRNAALPDIDPFWVRWSAFAEPYLEAAE